MSFFRLAAIAALVLAGAAGAQAPRELGFQGRLEDPAGVPVTGSHDLTFRVYATSLGGTALASETDALTLDPSGLFATTLGDQATLDPADFQQQLWVGVAVDGGPELSPRIPLRAAPYALRASRAERLSFPSADKYFTSPSAPQVLAVGEENLVVLWASSAGVDYTLDLPDPTAPENVGRLLMIVTGDGLGTVTFSPAPQGCSTWTFGDQYDLVSDGVVWHCR